MERVECVTVHVRESQSMDGAVLSDAMGNGGEYLDGSLRVIVEVEAGSAIVTGWLIDMRVGV
jgi:hypothetical protein